MTMHIDYKKLEIDHHTLKLIVGLIAIFLPVLTQYFSSGPLDSISAAYYENYWPRDIFVGFLFAIASFLFAYNGYEGDQASSLTRKFKWLNQFWLSKAAALSAIGIALFPCDCGGNEEVIPSVHGISAAIMFTILAIFCYFFYERAHHKYLKKEANYRKAKLRSIIYAASGLVIVLSIVLVGIDWLSENSLSTMYERLVFQAERAGLIAFGVAWLTASRILPFVTHVDERIKLFSIDSETKVGSQSRVQVDS